MQQFGVRLEFPQLREALTFVPVVLTHAAELLEMDILLKYPFRGLGLSSCRWRLDSVLWFTAVRSMVLAQ